MGNSIEDINKVLESTVLCTDIGRLLSLAKTFLASNPDGELLAKCTLVEENYGMLLDFASRGIYDPKRDDVFGDILRNIYSVLLNIRTKVTTRENTTYSRAVMRTTGADFSHDTIRAGLEDFVSSLPFIALEPEQTRQAKAEELYKSHQDMASRLFDHILVSGQWSEADSSFYSELLLSPTIDSRDTRLMVSAVTLSLLRTFDYQKVRTLYNTILSTQDEGTRQRAIVGFAMSVRTPYQELYPEVEQMVNTLCSNKVIGPQMLELQYQMVYTLTVKEDTDILKKDIIPGIVESQNIRMNGLGNIEEVEEDPMDDILGTHKTEERMAKLEAGMNKMMEMEKAGSDIYFGGFAQMKRFPFFYTISNWFCPFYMEHPDLKPALTALGGKDVLKNIMNSGTFCDSDRYSFAIAISSVFEKMPPSVREMVSNGAGMPMSFNIDGVNEAASVRRLYLQDLYRFFELYSSKSDFSNPFAPSHTRHAYLFMADRSFLTAFNDAAVYDFCSFLLRRKRYNEVVTLLTARRPKKEDWQWYKYMGIADYHSGHLLSASSNLGIAHDAAPSDYTTLRLYALSLMKTNQSVEAVRAFEELADMKPGVLKYDIYLCLALLNSRQTEHALNKAYELSLNNEGDVRVARVLAWTLLCAGRPADAVKEYEKLMSDGNTAEEDFLNIAYAHWLSGDMPNAVTSMADFMKIWMKTEEYNGLVKMGLTPHACLLRKFSEDMFVFSSHKISSVDRDIMADLVLRKMGEEPILS